MNVYVARSTQPQAIERFDPLKLHYSILNACYMVRTLEGEAHQTARQVCERVIEWLDTKTEVTSTDIRRIAGHFLNIYHPDAAYVYQNQKDMV